MILKTFLIEDTSPANGTDAAGTEVNGLLQYDWFTVDAKLTQATGDTLDVYLQRYVNGEWLDWIHFTQLAAGSTTFRYTIDSKETETGPVTVGVDTSPALAAGKFSCSHPGNRVRAYYVSGASTSAGAAQVITITCHAPSR